MTVSGTDSLLYRVANPMVLEIFIAQPSTLGWADLALRRKLPITMFLKCCRLTDGQALDFDRKSVAAHCNRPPVSRTFGSHSTGISACTALILR